MTAETGPCGSRQYRGADVRPDEVALGVDARDPADVAVCFAFEAARRRSARVRAVHAWELPCPADGWMPFAVPEADRATWEDEQVQMLSDVLRPWREKYPQIPVLKDVLRFTAAAALVRESMRMELLVVGRRSPALGPVVDVVRHGRCPFAVVPS
ncbi:hypothetical protein SLUN_35920 [Streptomyces lunaelactis]|uniref:UspA domain-containing protein n=1 Tax=Streptomyces lunaelactis TaxID=1535768 RepID=A0A2R4TFF7_9ACTN|nr:hypothetical protein SLUN_35920 [Streptomyces lunaelactis]NUK02726.1 universal stress protein [Streptomyces lunaelactis]NUK16766.1 universal stress protein [Streptomyces lunaelactis]NUK86191.1 universal stress protein [Streptomyces lunaelactis]